MALVTAHPHTPSPPTYALPPTDSVLPLYSLVRLSPILPLTRDAPQTPVPSAPAHNAHNIIRRSLPPPTPPSPPCPHSPFTLILQQSHLAPLPHPPPSLRPTHRQRTAVVQLDTAVAHQYLAVVQLHRGVVQLPYRGRVVRHRRAAPHHMEEKPSIELLRNNVLQHNQRVFTHSTPTCSECSVLCPCLSSHAHPPAALTTPGSEHSC